MNTIAINAAALHRLLASFATFATFSGALLGCAGDVPKASMVEDLRVLAIRAEPPEILIDRHEPAATRAVSFEALVVDPRGLPMTYEWRFCPVESDQTCGDFADARARAPQPLQPALDAARAQRSAGQAPTALDGQPSRAIELQPFTVDVADEVFSYHLAHSALGLGNGAWTSAVLAVGAAGETLSAQKRLTLNARDLSQWNPELAPAGWQICSGEPAAPAGCLPLRPRTPNGNPAIAAVEIAHGEAANLPFTPLPAQLTVAAGQTIRLRPVLAAGAAEDYQSIESTLMGSNLVVVDKREEPIVSWFATAGELDQEQTAPQLTKSLDNEFTAPATVPEGNGATLSIFMVVRDQRGGIGWTRVEVTVTPAPAPSSIP